MNTVKYVGKFKEYPYIDWCNIPSSGITSKAIMVDGMLQQCGEEMYDDMMCENCTYCLLNGLDNHDCKVDKVSCVEEAPEWCPCLVCDNASETFMLKTSPHDNPNGEGTLVRVKK